jgi:hypothetical protein
MEEDWLVGKEDDSHSVSIGAKLAVVLEVFCVGTT